MLPAELITKLNECASTNFSAVRDNWFDKQTLFSGLVIAGLIFEGPELIHEMLSIARSRIPSFRCALSETLVEYAKIAAFGGWILIIVGLLGEMKASSKIVDLSARIQECGDAKVRQAILEAGDAATSAKTARDEADAAKVASGKAQGKADAAENAASRAKVSADAADARAQAALSQANDAARRAGKAEASLGKAETEAKNAETSASNALILAHEARQEAGSFEGDIARLREQAADRVLDEYQQEQVRLRVFGFFNVTYELACNGTPEEQHLLGEIDAAVSSAGWTYVDSDNKLFRSIFKWRNGRVVEQWNGKGVEIGFSKGLTAKFKPAADALAHALTVEGIKASAVTLRDDDASPNHIHVSVGSK